MSAQVRSAVIVVTGVAGSGKTTVGRLLAERLQCSFLDGDDLHPAANVEKMAAGEPLTDADRAPWLDAIAAWIDRTLADGRSGVVACSALRQAYRDRLRAKGVRFVRLDLPASVAADRVRARPDHFMPAALVESQVDALEPAGPGERILCVAVEHQQPSAVVDEVLRGLQPA
ncbi:MAG TPA: gluconokinase [Jatrophihabitantaceae bacterium]|jgi:gluconokinase|nr:gluconokinase [Jatrophihabitantaceae bacterium]